MSNFRKVLLVAIFSLSVLGLPLCWSYFTSSNDNLVGLNFWGISFVILLLLVISTFVYIFDEYCKSIEEIKMLKEIENTKMKCEEK